MPEIRKCDGCSQLNKKKKTNPCNLGFSCKFDKATKIFLRPSKCRKKIIKEDPKKELKKYKERAIDAFQMWVRYRDNFTCCTCGFHIDKDNKEAKKLVHGGHFLSRKFTQLLLDPKNCHAQCRTCNGLQDWLGISPKYILFMLNRYGKEVFEYLTSKLDKKVEYTIEDWKNLAIYWEKQLQEIKKKS